MHEDNHADELDRLIDQALSSYGAEPPAHLETKIVAESRSTPMLVKKSASARWVSIASGIAAAVIAAFLLIHDQGHSSNNSDQVASGSKKISIASSKATPTTRPGAIHSQAVSVRLHRPHPSIAKAAYPEAPLTDQEQMLMDLAAHHPNEARQLISLDGQETKPITITPLSVQPISTEPLKIAALRIEPLP
jgi:hypothetical protein